MYSKDYIFMTELTFEPTSYKATQHPRWEETMKQKYESIMKNETWTLMNLSSRKVPITMKWVYKTKTTKKWYNGKIENMFGGSRI
jgi:hypothetical protein